jgi:hypothetical protein
MDEETAELGEEVRPRCTASLRPVASRDVDLKPAAVLKA